MRLLVDVNLSPSWAAFFRDAGHHALHWLAIGPHNAPDTDLVGYAIDQGFVILTRDLDFGAILAASRLRRPSVILLRGPRQFPQVSGKRVLEVLDLLEKELEAGVFVTIDVERMRYRLLPILQ